MVDGKTVAVALICCEYKRNSENKPAFHRKFGIAHSCTKFKKWCVAVISVRLTINGKFTKLKYPANTSAIMVVCHFKFVYVVSSINGRW